VRGKITIGRFSQVGAGSIIMPGVTLGEGVAVGAMALVKKDLDAWGIYAGNPVRLIKPRERGLLNLYVQWQHVAATFSGGVEREGTAESVSAVTKDAVSDSQGHRLKG
jgi:serine acetyltransferase